jgi:hypothetical protein
MKISKIAIAIATTLAISSMAVVPASAAPISGHTYSVSPAAAIGSEDSAAINAYKTAKANYRAAVADYRAKKNDFKAANAAYKTALQQFKASDKSYANAIKVIGKTFRDSVAAAKAAFKTEFAAATNAEQKLAAKNKYAQAKATAASNRAAALAALGFAPVKPVAPVKPAKPVKPTR